MIGWRCRWVEKDGAICVRGDDGDLVGMIECQVGIDEDEQGSEEGVEREDWGEDGPGLRIGIDHNYEERGGRLY